MATFDAGTIEAVLRLRDEFTGVAKRAATQAQTLGSSFTQAGQRAQMAGAGLTAGLTLPLVGIGTAAVKASTNLNASMAEIATLIPGNTERVKALKGSVQELAIATGQGTADMAGGLYQVISAVGDTQDTVKILDINARAATAGLSTTSEAIQLTSAVTKGYGETSSAAFQQVSDLAFQAVKLGQTTFPELAGSIGRVVPLSAELQVSQEELFGVMATGTGVTGGAAEVSTQLRGVLQSLLSPTAGMTTLLASMGLESGKALIEQQGLQGAIDTVVGAAEKAGAPLQDYVSSIEGQTLALALAGPQADTFTEKLAAMQTATGTTDQAFAEITGGINAAGHQFKQLWREVTVAAQRFGDDLMPHLLKLKPTITDLLEGLKATVQWFADLPAPVQKTILVTVGLVAAIGPLLLVVGQMSLGLGALLPLLGSLGSGFAMLMTPSAAFAAVLGKVGLLLAPLKALLVVVGGAFTVFTWPVTLAIAALAALLVGTKEGRAVLMAIGRLIKESLIWVFNQLRDVLAWTGEAVIWLGEQFTKMVPQFVLDSLDWVAKAIGGVADAIGRANDLSQLTRDMEDLAEGGRLTGEALETVARRAMALRDQGKPLTDELKEVVARFEEMQFEAAHLKSMLDALSEITSLDYLSTVTMQLAESGQASSDVMRVIAERAQALQPEGVALSKVLQNVVNAYGEAATAGKGFGDNTGDAGPPVKALSDEVQELVDQFQGRGLIQSAIEAAEAVRYVGGVSTLTADDQDRLRETVNGAMDAYQRMGQAVPPVVRGLADQLNALHDVRDAARESAEALEALRQAEDALLVTAPTLTLSWDEMLSVGQKLGPEIHGMTMGTIEAIPPTIALADAFVQLKTEAPEALAKTQGFFTGVAHGFQDLWKGISGRQGISGLLKNVGSGLSEGLGQILSGGIASAINVAVGVAWTGLKKICGFFKGLFGGVSEAEKAGRQTAGAFRDGVIATLNDGQLAEASQAALGAWRGTIGAHSFSSASGMRISPSGSRRQRRQRWSPACGRPKPAARRPWAPCSAKCRWCWIRPRISAPSSNRLHNSKPSTARRTNLSNSRVPPRSLASKPRRWASGWGTPSRRSSRPRRRRISRSTSTRCSRRASTWGRRSTSPRTRCKA